MNDAFWLAPAGQADNSIGATDINIISNSPTCEIWPTSSGQVDIDTRLVISTAGLNNIPIAGVFWPSSSTVENTHGIKMGSTAECFWPAPSGQVEKGKADAINSLSGASSSSQDWIGCANVHPPGCTNVQHSSASNIAPHDEDHHNEGANTQSQ